MDDEATNDSIPSSRGWTVLFVVSVVLLIMVVSFGVGLIAERTVFSRGGLFDRSVAVSNPESDSDPTSAQAFPRLTEVKRLLESEYFYRPTSPEAAATFAAELDQDALAGMATAAATPAGSLAEYRQDLEYAGIHGMTSGLEDEFTVFLEPAIQAPLADDLRGEYEGVGVVVHQPEGRFTIVSVFPGSPAQAAGLLPNDVILEADGTPLTGLDSVEALSLIRGPAGTSVRLTLERPGEPEPFSVEVERQPIITPAVVYEPVADGSVGWIRIGIFGDKTTAQLDEALARAEADGVSGIVLDLRGNGGGWVTSAQEVIGRFVPDERGPALFEDLQPGGDDALAPRPILNGGPVLELPVVVVVNEGTASAAEIVAGALRHYDRAALVGTHTYGKGSVQRVHDFADGSSARVTTAQWLTPDQEPIPEGGLQPAVLVEAVPDETEDGPDEQLEAAIELLRGQDLGALPHDAAATPGFFG
jgi:carboxyl-terminal processing protease